LNHPIDSRDYIILFPGVSLSTDFLKIIGMFGKLYKIGSFILELISISGDCCSVIKKIDKFNFEARIPTESGYHLLVTG
jgi:hypothetical protein